MSDRYLPINKTNFGYSRADFIAIATLVFFTINTSYSPSIVTLGT